MSKSVVRMIVRGIMLGVLLTAGFVLLAVFA